MNRLLHRSSSALLVLLLSVTLSLSMPANDVEAGGGMGSLNTGVNGTTISLSWSFPNKFEPKGANPYTICWKETWDIEGACDGGSVQHVATTSYTISGLAAGTNYKIKVLCFCTKNGKNQKDRKIDTTSVKTNGSGYTIGFTNKQLASGSIWATSISSSSISLQWSDQSVGYPPSEFYTICYKRAWGLSGLSSCESGGVPSVIIDPPVMTGTISGLSRGGYKIRIMAHGGGGAHVIGDLRVKVP